jgi:hypothetical protein
MSNYKENTDALEPTSTEDTEVNSQEEYFGSEDQHENIKASSEASNTFVGNEAEEAVDVNQLFGEGDSGTKEYEDEIETAVLLIKNKQGAVLPITKLDNLKMDKQANAHEVMRMCADVQDQISAIRVVGELAQIFDNINKRSLQEVAKLLATKMDNNLQ